MVRTISLAQTYETPSEIAKKFTSDTALFVGLETRKAYNTKITRFYDQSGSEVLSFSSLTKTLTQKDGLVSADLLIGRNLKDSLQQLWHHQGLQKFFSSGGRLWDLNYAKYLLSAQARSIDAKSKNVPIVESESGHCLRRECQQQVDIAVNQDQLTSIWNRMDVIGWTLELHTNGIFFEKTRISRDKKSLADECKQLEKKMADACVDWLDIDVPESSEVLFPWKAVDFWRAIFFGEVVIEYGVKASQRSTKISSVEVQVPYLGAVFPTTEERDELFLPELAEWEDRAVDNGAFRVRLSDTPSAWNFIRDSATFFEDILEKSASKGCSLSNMALRYRRVLYLSQVLLREEDVFAKAATDSPGGVVGRINPSSGCVHAKFSCSSTATTRIQASEPNVFTLPKDPDFLQYMSSRFGHGKIIEADFSQLELRVAALLTQDERMITKLNADVDFHSLRASLIRPQYSYEEIEKKSKKERDPEFLKLRTQAKSFSFQRLYGASPMTISEITGLPIDEVHRIIREETKMFPQVEAYYRKVLDKAEADFKEFSKSKTNDSTFGFWRLPTGSRVPFVTKAFNSTRGPLISKTHLRNYPVQCFAAEIVQNSLSRLWRHFIYSSHFRGKALVINSVHDSVWIDCHTSVLQDVVKDVKTFLEDCWLHMTKAIPSLRKLHPVKFPVSIHVSEGSSMDKMNPQ